MAGAITGNRLFLIGLVPQRPRIQESPGSVCQNDLHYPKSRILVVAPLGLCMANLAWDDKDSIRAPDGQARAAEERRFVHGIPYLRTEEHLSTRGEMGDYCDRG